MRWKEESQLLVFSLVLVLSYVSAENITTLSQQERSGKQGGLFSVVSFPNAACKASNGLNGTCMTATECSTIGGEDMGSCARGFGTCCFVKVNSCGSTIKYNRTYIQNSEYPDSYIPTSDTECVYRFLRQSDDTCNVRLDFTVFDSAPPDNTANSKWECVEGTTDYHTVTPAGNIYSGLILCGYNNGHHIYIDMGTPTANPNYAEMKLTFDADSWDQFQRRWNILVSYIDCGTSYTPPRGCERYFFGNGGAGVIMAFNYDQPTKKYAARLNGDHTVCVRREKGMCQISYVPPDVDFDDEGFAMNGNPASLFKGRNACGNPTPVPCASYVRIPQGTGTGVGPFNPPPDGRCDRFCGRRLCLTHQGCTSADHNTIISRQLPFTLGIELQPHSPDAYENRGYKLNYVQSKC